MAIYLLGFADGELHAIPLEDAALVPPDTPACEVPALVAEIKAKAAIAAAAGEQLKPPPE